jgi:hypothetical protein
MFESTGRIHEKTLNFIKKVAKRVAADEERVKENGLYNYFMTAISVCLQRGLANAYINGRARIHGSGAESNHHRDYSYSREAIVEYGQLRGGGV